MGDFIWAKQIGGGSNSGAGIRGMKIGTDGIYLAGAIGGTVDVDPGVGVVNLTPVGSPNAALIEKLDTAGNYIWAKQINDVGILGLALDSYSNYYITGAFSGTVDFDPGTSIVNLTATSPVSAYGADIFIEKLDSVGNFQWVKQIGAGYDDIPQGIAVDRWGNCAVTGYFNSTVDFDPGSGVSNIAATSRNIFTMSLNTNGGFRWAKSVDNHSTYDGQVVVIDTSGSVYTTGGFLSSSDFDPGSGVYMLNDGGVFIQKLDSSGNFSWARSFNADIPFSIDLDHAGSVYVTGYFSNSYIDFDPSINTFLLSAGAQGSGFIEKLCPSTYVLIEPISDTFCVGQIAILSTPAISGATYSWGKNDTLVQTGTSNTFQATTSGEYDVTVTGVGCPSTSNRQKLTFIPSVVTYFNSAYLGTGPFVLKTGLTITITGSPRYNLPSGGTLPLPTPYKVEWLINGIPVDTTYDSFSYTYTSSPKAIDTVTAVLTSLAFTCATTTSKSAIIFKYPAGVDELPAAAQEPITLYPNPANNTITLNGLKVNARLKAADLSGRVLQTWTANAKQQTFDISNIAPGYYLLNIEEEHSKTMTAKAVIKR